jgi:hypothetical protein
MASPSPAAPFQTVHTVLRHAAFRKVHPSACEFLLPAVGVTTVRNAVALYETYYPEDRLKPQAIPMLKAILGES